MKHRIVNVKNVARLSDAADALIDREIGLPGMGLIYGETGFGKTTAAAWLINQCHGVYVRCVATSTPSSLLGAILVELDLDMHAGANCARMVDAIVQKLARTGRPLFIDEADYVAEQKRLTDTLRDVHDLSTVPVILIGMAGIQRTLQRSPQIIGRIAQWVEFGPCDIDDARLLADQICEVRVHPDLLRRLHQKSGGSVRLLVVGLARIEQHARAKGLAAIGTGDWTGGDDFHLGRAPDLARRKAPVSPISEAR